MPAYADPTCSPGSQPREPILRVVPAVVDNGTVEEMLNGHVNGELKSGFLEESQSQGLTILQDQSQLQKAPKMATTVRRSVQHPIPPVKVNADGFQLIPTETNIAGRTLHRILGMVTYLNELVYAVVFKDGEEFNSVLVQAELLNDEFPQEVIRNFEKHLCWVFPNIDSDDEENED